MFGTVTPPIATDSVLPKFPYYFRTNPDTSKNEMNQRISAKVVRDDWLPIPNRCNTVLNGTDDRQLGEVLVAYVSEARTADAWMERHDTIRQQAFEAIRIIGERLIQESEARSWCSEFDQIIQEVNNALPGPFMLPVREHEYEVTWTETYTVTVSRSATFTATNEDEAIDYAKDYDTADTDELTSAIRYGDWEYSDHNSDYEASEQ
jgi:hypothetical protein